MDDQMVNLCTYRHSVEVYLNTASAHEIVLAVRSIRRFTEDVAKLLSTAREILDNAGWKCRTTQAVTVSVSLNNPSYWIPQDSYLFVFNSKLPKALAFVSVLFDSIEDPGQFLAPVVVAGHVQFADSIGGNWRYRWSRACELASVPIDGSFRELPTAVLSKAGDLVRAEIAVNSLDSITSAESLETQILLPLLARIANGG